MMARQVKDSKQLSDESRTGERDITGRDNAGTGGSDAMVTNKEGAPNDAAPIGMTPDQVQEVLDTPRIAPPVAAAPPSAEDPSRTFHAAHLPDRAAAPSFPGFPKTKYHPVYGGRSACRPEPGGARLCRLTTGSTRRGSRRAPHRSRGAAGHPQQPFTVKVNAALSAAANDGTHDLPDAVVNGDAGVVRNSVAATESLKGGFAEPL
jgi:hypothetical protein